MADLKESNLFNNLEEQKNHWYYYHKTRVVRKLLECFLNGRVSDQTVANSDEGRPLRCMDIGAGNGIISRYLGASIGGFPATWDLVDSAYLPKELGQDLHSPSLVLYAAIPDESVYDVILAIDVVEHIENDAAFLNLLVGHLAKDGLLVICVPAFNFLWSDHDVFLEHYRRYTRRELVFLMRRTGLHVVNSGYLYVFLFPLVALIRLLGYVKRKGLGRKQPSSNSDLKVYPTLINRFLRIVMGIEFMLLQFLPWLGLGFGVSCVAAGIHMSALGKSSSSMTSDKI